MKGLRRTLAYLAAVGALLPALGVPALVATASVAGAATVDSPIVGTSPVGSPSAPGLWALGDSLTYGLSGGASAGGASEQTMTPGGYRGMLDADLRQDGVTYRFVGTSTGNPNPVLTSEGQAAHDGHPGYRIDQDAADLNGSAGGPTDDGGEWMTRPVNPIAPNVAVVILGGNDILQHYDPTTTFPTANGQADYTDPSQVATFVADMASRLQSLLGKLESLHPGTRLVLGDTTPIGKATPDPVTGPYAQAVAQVAAQENSTGVSVSYVDLWSLFVQQTPGGPVVIQGSLGPDNIHPTTAGYQIIANALRSPVEQQLSGGG
jgi:lysophospholipase L1-like esterase